MGRRDHIVRCFRRKVARSAFARRLGRDAGILHAALQACRPGLQVDLFGRGPPLDGRVRVTCFHRNSSHDT